MSTLLYRDATSDDIDLLMNALVVAVNRMRPSGEEITSEDVHSRPELAHYVVGFPADGEFGVVAENEGEGVAVAWVRQLSAADAGYGYVRDGVGELCLAVLTDTVRGQGVGTELVGRLVQEAYRRGQPALSLAVEQGNPAGRLYRRMGFRTVRETPDDLVMLLQVTDVVRNGGTAEAAP